MLKVNFLNVQTFFIVVCLVGFKSRLCIANSLKLRTETWFFKKKKDLRAPLAYRQCLLVKRFFVNRQSGRVLLALVHFWNTQCKDELRLHFHWPNSPSRFCTFDPFDSCVIKVLYLPNVFGQTINTASK